MKLTLDELLIREGWAFHERLRRKHPHPEASAGNSVGLERRWKELFGSRDWLRRLSWDDLTPEATTTALDPGWESVPKTPAWWPALVSAREACCSVLAGCGRPLPDGVSTDPRMPFAEVWWPAVDAAGNRVVETFPSTAAVIGGAQMHLLKRLCRLGERTLWELFRDAVPVGVRLSAAAGRAHPSRRHYLAFVHQLHAAGLMPLLSDYPVLGRLVAVTIQNWEAATVELFERLHRDLADLGKFAGLGSDAVLVEVVPGLGDLHSGGRSVTAVVIGGPSGVRCRFAYKPRCMQLEAAFSALLGSVQSARPPYPVRAPSIVLRGGYGYSEWVEQLPCRSQEELEGFYQNAGAQLAVLHLLGARDCHASNLVATRDLLYLVDAETLLQDPPEGNSRVNDSVLRCGFLPGWRVFPGEPPQVLDSSALGSPSSPDEVEVQGWRCVNSDGMHWGLIRTAPTEPPTSLPYPSGAPHRTREFSDSLTRGLTEMLDWFRIHAELFHGEDGLLQGFEDTSSRLILRATRVYSVLAAQAMEPAALRSAAARGLCFEPLCRAWLACSEKPPAWSTLQAEFDAMERWDVPLFRIRCNRQDLYSDALEPLVHNFVSGSPLNATVARLESLTTEEIGFQAELAQGAIAASGWSGEVKEVCLKSSGTIVPDKPGKDPERFLQEAFRLGELLCSKAIRRRVQEREVLQWLGLEYLTRAGVLEFGPVTSSLYGGSPGIALLLAEMSRHAAHRGDTRRSEAFARDALGALDAMLCQFFSEEALQAGRPWRDLPLGLCGVGGFLLASTTVARCLHNHEHGEQAKAGAWAVAMRIPEAVLRRDPYHDVLTGTAGLIGPLLCLAKTEPGAARSSHTLALAATAGETLLATQQPDGGWPFPGATRALTGFSHGAAGVAAALAALHRDSPEPALRSSLERALAFERSTFVTEARNWPDFLQSPTPSCFRTSWCHGAPGIALARLIILENGMANDDCREELDIALQTTLGGQSSLDHLCCGAFGRAAILALASRQPARANLLADAFSIAGERLHRAHASTGSYHCLVGDENRVLVPGLFTGIAGVALSLLSFSTGCLETLAAALSGGLLPLSETRDAPRRSLQSGSVERRGADQTP